MALESYRRSVEGVVTMLEKFSVIGTAFERFLELPGIVVAVVLWLVGAVLMGAAVMGAYSVVEWLIEAIFSAL